MRHVGFHETCTDASQLMLTDAKKWMVNARISAKDDLNEADGWEKGSKDGDGDRPREEKTHCNAGAARSVSNLLKTTRCQDQGEWSKAWNRTSERRGGSSGRRVIRPQSESLMKVNNRERIKQSSEPVYTWTPLLLFSPSNTVGRPLTQSETQSAGYADTKIECALSYRQLKLQRCHGGQLVL